MTAHQKIESPKPTGLALLRAPFPANQISKLPKPTKAQTDALKNDRSLGIKCPECGAWHHKHTVHLDYVGHAALTDRLLDVDPMWNWEPVAFDQHGKPALDQNGGMWIKLTVCDVTRLGYGHAEGKSGGDAIKEVIGDALRNAAMRFGAALDLWHKGDLHLSEEPEPQKVEQPTKAKKDEPKPEATRDRLIKAINEKGSVDDLTAFWRNSYVTDAMAGLNDAMQLVVTSAYNTRFDTLEGAEAVKEMQEEYATEGYN